MRICQRSINPRKRKSPNYSTILLVDGNTREAQDFHPTAYQDRYQVMYYNIFDTVITSLKDRFDQSSFAVYENIESLLLKTIKGEDISDESEYIIRICTDEVNITQFEIEANVLRAIFYQKKVDCFDSFLSDIRTSDIRKLPREQRLLLPFTVHKCKLLLVIQPLPRQESDCFPLRDK